MSRFLLPGLLLLAAGCQASPERQALRLLAENATPLSYSEMLERATLQLRVANEAFYKDFFAELEDAARALEQTARFLPRAPELTAEKKKAIQKESDELALGALKLAEAARARDVKQVHERMQNLLPRVRTLHSLAPTERPIPPPIPPI